MLTLTRDQAKQLRAIIRSTTLDQIPRGEWPLLVAHSDAEGGWIEVVKGDVALRWHLNRSQISSRMTFRSTLLAEIEGKKNDVVTLQQTEAGKGKATWDDCGVPCTVDFDLITRDSRMGFPKAPSSFTPMESDFLSALREASRTVAEEGQRFALSRILLRGGRSGQVIATDSRQLLIQSGFGFSWAEDCLIQTLKLFGRKNLLSERCCQTGRTDSHFFLRTEMWTLALRIDVSSRYPEVDAVIPNSKTYGSTLCIGSEDAEMLQKALPKLPGRKEDHAPITLDLQSTPVIRARGGSSTEATEIVLTGSKGEGIAMQVAFDRDYLLRALSLGLREIRLATPEQPVLSKDEKRTYLWMPLNREAIVPSSAEVSRISVNGPATVHPSSTKRRTNPMSKSQNGVSHEKEHSSDPLGELIEEAEELRRLHQQAGGRLSRLITMLKQQRRQSKVFRQAVASLKQLDLGG